MTNTFINFQLILGAGHEVNMNHNHTTHSLEKYARGILTIA